ncbi:cobalt transporter CbiM [Marinobacter sp. BSs20148]|jgi:cobalt/nickel transport system permease protein|uniref:cobalt transporter CbiM n=1 Tax=Marinobacter sp. BSs20148 TaxID=490759 RepID=UPI0002776894|nr:cobalt transporter CbiM [Marinobacter sp. BSs20148]AFP30244.1 cobalamin (vitamin B12) biosynthesis CbiM protein [Marinobacter sp. BSs20148]
MAHIPDGVLATPILICGAVVTVTAVAIALRRLQPDQIPQAAVMASTFFVASLISVPVGVSSVHLILNGLMGLVLGWAAVPAILVALLLQTIFFGYGGVLVLGVNVMNIALPAILCALFFRGPLQRASQRGAFVIGALSGALAVVMTGLLVCTALAFSSNAFVPAAKVLFATFVPLALVEAMVTGATVSFLKRVSPELLFARGPAHGSI